LFLREREKKERRERHRESSVLHRRSPPSASIHKKEGFGKRGRAPSFAYRARDEERPWMEADRRTPDPPGSFFLLVMPRFSTSPFLPALTTSGPRRGPSGGP
jgi:hypothetical protein